MSHSIKKKFFLSINSIGLLVCVEFEERIVHELIIYKS